MSGLLIGTLILWLIIAIIVIVVVVYVVNWLYHRSSKEVSFVRTGFLGERVVINGGAFVLPFIHDFTPVNMNVLPMQIVREKGDAVITRDRMRIDIEADFYVRVQADARGGIDRRRNARAGARSSPSGCMLCLSGKFVSALRSVASEMTMEQMHEQRGDYVARVKAEAPEALAQNGLELESVAITDLDQTDLEFFNPSNRFDAEGLTRLIEDIEERRKLRNDIEQDSMIKIRTRNLEAERQALDIERDSEAARLAQQRDIEVRRAVQRAEVARERALRETEAEQAQISAREAIEKSRIANEQAISEARIASEREMRQKEIERTRAVEEVEIAAREGIEKGAHLRTSVLSTPPASHPSAKCARHEIERARAIEEAEIEAREDVEKARIPQERAVTESRIVNEEETRRREIERTRAVEEAEIAAREATEKLRIAQMTTINAERIASDERTRSLEIARTRSIEEAEIAAQTRRSKPQRSRASRRSPRTASPPTRRPGRSRSPATR